MEESVTVGCPYCGEGFVTFVDLSAGNQDYTEDCQVCCHPILMHIRVAGGSLVGVECEREN